MPFIVTILYVLACAVCGMMGRGTAFGFFGHFLIALLFTPIVGFLILMAGRPSRALRKRIENATVK